MEQGFIRAHVASHVAVVEHGSLQELHHVGRLRTEGKEYQIRDGDVVEFLFRPS
jgi:ribosome-binding ATPase YchF (GTP1/OBG family)